MRTIRIKLYKFSELSKDAQQKAMEQLSDINVDYNWWEGIYQDAANIGLKITSFELDRRRNAEGEFILSANEVAANIFRDHDESCETYKTASLFMEEWEPVFSKYIETEEEESKLMDIEEEFLKSLLEDYSIMLQKESEYLQSAEAIKDTIEANEYEFTKDGKLN